MKTKKINYVIIVLGNQKIEGECTYWEIMTKGTGTYVKLIVKGEEFIVGINNVILTEK